MKKASLLTIIFFVAAFFAWFYFYEMPGKNPSAPTAPLPYENAVKQLPLLSNESEETSINDPGVEAFNSGEYYKAAFLFKKQLALSPDNQTLRHNVAESLSALGAEEIKRNDNAGAKRYFLEAISYEKSPGLYKGLAYSQISLGELDEAVKTLSEIPKDEDVEKLHKSIYTFRAKAAFDAGDRESAKAFLEKAVKEDPLDNNIKEALRNLESEDAGEKGFTSRSGSHFIVKYEGGENAVAGHVIGILLEEAYYKIGVELNFYPDDKITAVLYTRETFTDVTRSPSWGGAIYDGKIKLPAGGLVEKTALLEKVLFHEYTHAMVHRLSGGRAPVWLNEGLAQYMEGKNNKGDYERLAASAARNKEFSISALEGTFLGMDYNQAGAAYAISLSATEYLVREFGMGSVKGILEGLGSGKTMNDAFLSSVYLSYEAFNENWLKYAARR